MSAPWAARELDEAARLRAAGRGVREIAALISRSRAHVSRLLSRRGCPAPGRDETRERQGKGAAARNRAFCESLGWPEVVVPGQARVLDALARCGPMDHAALALAAGWTLRRGPQGGLRSCDLHRHLLPLIRPFGPPACRRRYVETLPGRPATYRVAGWLLARKEADG